MKRPSLVRKCPSVRYNATDDTGVVLDIRQGMFWGLSESGRLVWDSVVEGEHTIEACAEMVADRYGVDRDLAMRDVAAFLTQCVDRGLVHASHGEEERGTERDRS